MKRIRRIPHLRLGRHLSHGKVCRFHPIMMIPTRSDAALAFLLQLLMESAVRSPRC